jgi:hypothetical protein
MTPVFSVRRRAEEFDSLVEGLSTGDDTRYAELLELVSTLRSAPAPQARPEFVTSLREQLMLAADTLLVPGDTRDTARLALPVRTKPVRERRIAAAVGGIAIVGATTSMAMAAQSALPGDVLYPLKRAIENAEAGISVNNGQKGATLLATASGRLDEVTALTSGGRADDGAAIAETLNAFTEQATEASDLLLTDYATTGHESSISDLRDFTAESMDTLAALEALIPADARDELLHAASMLTQIDLEAAQACPDCAGVGITEIPAILTSSATFGSAGSVATPVRETDASGGSQRDGRGDQQTEEPAVPETDGNPLPPGSVLNPDTDTDTSGGGEDEPADEDPITSLTNGLTGGDDQPASNDTTLPGVPEADDVTETVDETLDPVLGTDVSGGDKKN